MTQTNSLQSLLEEAGTQGVPLRLFVRPVGTLSYTTEGVPVRDAVYAICGYRLGTDPRRLCSISLIGWLSPLWQLLEERGWQVSRKEKLAGGEEVWTLTQAAQDAGPGAPTREELLPYVARVRPLAGHRAHRALELALSGKVRRLPAGPHGEDRWQVASARKGGNYTVSIRGGMCTCPDAENGAPRWKDAPLCKHRLAAMFLARWQEEHGTGDGAQQNGRTEPAEYVTLVPPAAPHQQWRWACVRKPGQPASYSAQQFPDESAARQAAELVARAKRLPLLA